MLIEYKNANIYQRHGIRVLENVNFHVDEGEFVYIIGRVGSGKTSLLRTFYFELDMREAEKATVFDYDLLTLRRKDIPMLRRQMGVIFQDFQLLGDRTVYKNLEFVLKATGWKDKSEINNRIGDVLSDVGLEDKGDKMPHELSGGEQQRIAIARALLNSPHLIVADEPTGNLDYETANGIMLLLRHIAETGTAVIMSTHNTQLLNQYPGIVYHCHEYQLDDITSSYNRMNLIEE